MKQVGDQRVSTDAPAAQISNRQASRQASGTHDFDAVCIDLNEDVGPFHEPVSVHDRVRDCLAHSLGRILGNILSLESLDAIGGTSIAFDETYGVLDVSHDPAIEILAIKDMNLVHAAGQQARDVGLGKETSHVLGEEEYASIAKQQSAVHPFCCIDVDEHVLDPGLTGDARTAEPRMELVQVEIIRVNEPRAGCQIESDGTLTSEAVADLGASQLLSDGSLTRE